MTATTQLAIIVAFVALTVCEKGSRWLILGILSYFQLRFWKGSCNFVVLGI